MNPQRLLLLLGLLLPLSLDTFVLSAALSMAGLPKNKRLHTSLILAVFEAGMPVVGVLIGTGVSDVVGHYAGYIAGIVIGLVGLLMLRPSGEEAAEERRLKLLAHARGFSIIGLGISISLDELAMGLSLGLLHVPLLAVVIYLGLQAFAAAQAGLWVGTRLSEAFRENAVRIAGLILVVVAVGILALELTGHHL